MKKFREFVDERLGVVSDPATHNIEQADLLQRIVRQHGSRFRNLLKAIIRDGEVDDDPELLADLKELMRSLFHTAGEYPPRNKQRNDREPDIVSRPQADGGGGDAGQGNGGGEG